MAKHKVSVSIDGLRSSMVDDMNELKEAIQEVLNSGAIDEFDASELTDKFNQASCNINCFNCVYSEDVEGFSNMSDGPMVQLFNDEDE